MAKDPMQDLDELDTINAERVAAGLAETSSIAEARAWKAEQGTAATEQKPKETAKAEPPAAIEDVKQTPAAETVDFTAPVAARASAAVADNGELAAAKAEIQRLKSEAGRSTVLANELRDLKARAEEAERRAQEAEQRAEEAAQKAAGGGMFSFLTDEQRETMTPDAIAAIERGVSAYVNKQIAAVEAKAGSGIAETRQMLEQRAAAEAQREAAQRQAGQAAMWNDRIAPVIPKEVYGRFAGNPKWAEWGEQRYAGNYNADMFNAAVAELDHEAVIDQLQRFMRFAGITVPTKGRQPPVRVDESRGGALPQTDVAGGQKRYRYSDINAINQAFLRGQGLPTGWSMKDYTAWSNDMEKAQSEGRVVDEGGNPVYDQPL